MTIEKSLNAGIRIAVDTGGTFTDLCLFNDITGKFEVAKVPSTPSDPAEAVIKGVKQLLSDLNIRPDEILFFLHGTTVATNALLEGKGAPTALITTKGFEDVLLIGRQNRPRLYDFWAKRPIPIVPRHLCYGVSERVLFTGEVLHSMDEAEVELILQEINKNDIKTIAICLLHSYVNSVHEKRIKTLINNLYPETFITASSDILPEYREFERMSTVCINAYVMPKVDTYVAHLENMLNELGVASELYIMQSNGGVITAQTARESSARTVLSGPAGGALTGVYLSRSLSRSNVITIDIGGTSSDICLIKDGKPNLTTETDIDGYPIKLPMIDINTIGAGGGSIAWIDRGGALRVGPQSAGADPGPVCYGKGGEDPTVTDANVVLGRINPGFLLSGKMPVDVEKAREAIEEKIAGPLGLDVIQAAEGIITVVNATMIRGIRRVSVERGYDPRDFDLITFGGAGPLHGVDLAKALNIVRVIIPVFPGIASAFGMLSADVRHDYVQTHICVTENLILDEVNNTFTEMESKATKQLTEEGFQGQALLLSRFGDLRYAGQSYELCLSVPSGRITTATISNLVNDFHEIHKRAYGYDRTGEKVELVNLRLVGQGKLSSSATMSGFHHKKINPPPQIKHRSVIFQGQVIETPIYEREHLEIGWSVIGPAIIEQLDSTTVVSPTYQASVSKGRNIIIEVGETER